MTGWHTGPMAAFDVETTGVDPQDDRIVTASVVLIRPGTATDIRHHLLAVEVDIPEQATAVHGITTAHARTHGDDPAQALDQVATDLTAALQAGVPVVGANVPFDLTMLEHELTRHRLPTVVERCGCDPRPVVDVQVIDRHVDQYRRGKRTLTDLCRVYRVPGGEAHSSADDALAAARVAWAIAARYPQVGAMPLLGLHDCQVQWRRQQVDSLRRYWMREAEEMRTRAGRAADEAERELLDRDVAALEARIDGLDDAWPLRTTPVGGSS